MLFALQSTKSSWLPVSPLNSTAIRCPATLTALLQICMFPGPQHLQGESEQILDFVQLGE